MLRWTRGHTLAYLWAMYLGLLVVVWARNVHLAADIAPLVLVMFAATGWLVQYVWSVLVLAGATVLHLVMGFDMFALELGVALDTSLAMFAVGLAFLGAGRGAYRVRRHSRGEQAEHARAERLVQEREFKSRFLSMAVHELSTPLTPMRLETTMLRRRLGTHDDAVVRQSVERLDRSVHRLDRIVRDLLDASRVDVARLEVRPVAVDLARTINDVVAGSRGAADAKGVDLAAAVQAPLPALADEDRIAQVLHNLIDNAVKFTPPGGAVRVAAHASGGVAVSVSDTGLGMADEALDGLFQPFAQFHREERPGQGHGLGLFIAKGIAEAHGGTLTAQSAGPGQGSTFRLHLPPAA